MLGLAVILMVFLTAGFCAAELLRGFRLWKMALVLHRADVTGRALAAEKLMFAMIRLLGVDAGLGWAADTADQELSERLRGHRARRVPAGQSAAGEGCLRRDSAGTL